MCIWWIFSFLIAHVHNVIFYLIFICRRKLCLKNKNKNITQAWDVCARIFFFNRKIVCFLLFFFLSTHTNTHKITAKYNSTYSQWCAWVRRVHRLRHHTPITIYCMQKRLKTIIIWFASERCISEYY